MLINGEHAAVLSVDDRGFAYGDGVFTTFRARAGQLCDAPWHWARLQHACARLRLPMPETDLLVAEAAQCLADFPDGVLRLTLTRGVGGRGYRPPETACVNRIWTRRALPEGLAEKQQHGIAVRVCETRLAIQPQLAGIKHLNRLEQVLAWQEWTPDDLQISEGLMCDSEGFLIEGIQSNLFWRDAQDRWHTPTLDRCGVAGIQRQKLLHTLKDVQLGRYQLGDLFAAREVLVCNSVVGLWPVVACGEMRWPVGAQTRALQVALECVA